MKLARLASPIVVTASVAIVLFLAWGLPPLHAQGVPGIDANRCLAGKNKCLSKKLKGLLKCRERCQKSPSRCGQVQTDCEAKVMSKFDGGLDPTRSCFAKLEAKENPAKPDSVCTTTGDTSAMEAKADAVVADMLAVLEGTEPFSLCGNGIVEGDESCDDLNLGGVTCESLGFASGTLACTVGCGLETSGCVPNAPDLCGNGVIDAGEDCDFEPGGLGGETCLTQGQFLGGLLRCGANCQFDYSGCDGFNYVFVTSTTYSGDLGGITGADAKCQERAIAGGLPGVYKAWISSGNLVDGYASPATTFTQSPSAYALVDGTIVAQNWSALVGSCPGGVGTCLENPILLTEFGAHFGQGGTWTATATDGTPVVDPNDTVVACGSDGQWDGLTGSGGVGAGFSTGLNWTVNGNGSCPAGIGRLYCFQQ